MISPSTSIHCPLLSILAFLRNINIDQTTFYLLKPCFSLSLPSHCILNTSPIQNDHLVEMELEGNMVEEVVEVKCSLHLHCCSSWTTSWSSVGWPWCCSAVGLRILESTVNLFLAWIDICNSSRVELASPGQWRMVEGPFQPSLTSLSGQIRFLDMFYIISNILICSFIIICHICNVWICNIREPSESIREEISCDLSKCDKLPLRWNFSTQQ